MEKKYKYPQCTAKTKDGKRCTHPALIGKLCTTHYKAQMIEKGTKDKKKEKEK